MYDDIIFALYSPKDLVEWDRVINHRNDKSEDSGKKNYFLGITSAIASERYGSDLTTDWRIRYQMEKKNYNDYRSMKYYQQPDSYKYSGINNVIIPMFRMSEVYYIAAEAIYQTDLDKAKEYLKTVKRAEGLMLIWKM